MSRITTDDLSFSKPDITGRNDDTLSLRNNYYDCVGHAGTLRVYHHPAGRMSPALWLVLGMRGEGSVTEFGTYPSLASLRSAAYPLPDGTPARWTRIRRDLFGRIE